MTGTSYTRSKHTMLLRTAYSMVPMGDLTWARQLEERESKRRTELRLFKGLG